MIAAALSFAATPVGRYVVIGLAAAILVGGVLLYVYGQGEAAGAAAVTAAALAEAARRAAAARKASQNVDHAQGAIDADPNNRNRGP